MMMVSTTGTADSVAFVYGGGANGAALGNRMDNTKHILYFILNKTTFAPTKRVRKCDVHSHQILNGRMHQQQFL